MNRTVGVWPKSMVPYSVMLALALMLIGTSIAFAEVYKCTGPSGSVTLSNIEKGANCSKMDLPPLEPRKSIARPKAESQPAKVSEKPKSSYDAAAAERKRVIQEEMDLEKSRLNGVQLRIRELAAVPNKTPEQVKELVALQQKESMHTSNLQLLQKELNR